MPLKIILMQKGLKLELGLVELLDFGFLQQRDLKREVDSIEFLGFGFLKQTDLNLEVGLIEFHGVDFEEAQILKDMKKMDFDLKRIEV
jgi:hypothetical protein